MKTADFVKRQCVGTTCPYFCYSDGCHAYDGEECDAAFNHPIWRGLKMAERVTMLCEKRQNGVKDYSKVGAVCYDCARSAGFTQKNKVVGVWMDKCGICHKRKQCTDLHHDWKRKEKRNEN